MQGVAIFIKATFKLFMLLTVIAPRQSYALSPLPKASATVYTQVLESCPTAFLSPQSLLKSKVISFPQRLKKTCVLNENTCVLNENTCVLDESTCVLDKSTCVLNESTCVLDESTCVLNESTCVLNESTCVLNESTCVLNESTCVLNESTCV